MANTNAEIIALLQTDPSQAIRGVLDTLYLFNPATVNDLIELLNKVISNHGFLAVVVDELPETGQNGTVYFVPNGEGAPNSHDEYVWVAEKNAFELIGTTQVDLTDYVKNTDYASASNAGVVKLNTAYGIGAAGGGVITTIKAANDDIDKKTSSYRVIVPNNLDYAVKTSVTTNTIELTDDEKAAVRTWLSAVGTTEYATDGKVGVIKGSGASGLYCNSSGNLVASTASLSAYTSKPVTYVIGKGTLENVLAQYATAQYVDDQVFDVLDYVSNQTTPIKNNINQLDTNIRTVADWVNIKDEDGNRATLETEAQDAYRAINELNAKISDIETVADTAKSIAEGKATGYVFDTVEDMNAWLETNSSILKLGDNLYIRAVNVPDYWWDGETARQLETQKVDLTEYVKFTDYAVGGKPGVIKVSAAYGFGLAASNGYLTGVNRTLEQYNSAQTTTVISKGALENIKDDYIKRGITANTIELTDDEKTAARTWIGAIGDTDYAGTDGSPGTIRSSAAYGTQMVASGYLRAGSDTLESYNTRGVNFFVGKGTLENIKDDYVKRGLTENGIELTDDEKAAARTWLGALGSNDIKFSSTFACTVVNGYAQAMTIPTLERYNNLSQYAFIGKGTLESIKYDLVKQGITANTIALTDEEKAAAQAWLGVSGGTGGDYLPLSGGTLTGTLEISMPGSVAVSYDLLKFSMKTGKSATISMIGGATPVLDIDCGICVKYLRPNTIGGFSNTNIGNASSKWKGIYVLTTYAEKLNNGADIVIPTEGGTLALAPNTVAFTETTIELVDNTIHNTGETSSLTITLPTTDAMFTSQLNFTSGATATAFTAPDTIKWAGDDIVDNAFVPAANKRYSVMFYSDNVNVRAIVQGVE